MVYAKPEIQTTTSVPKTLYRDPPSQKPDMHPAQDSPAAGCPHGSHRPTDAVDPACGASMAATVSDSFAPMAGARKTSQLEWPSAPCNDADTHNTQKLANNAVVGMQFFRWSSHAKKTSTPATTTTIMNSPGCSIHLDAPGKE